MTTKLLPPMARSIELNTPDNACGLLWKTPPSNSVKSTARSVETPPQRRIHRTYSRCLSGPASKTARLALSGTSSRRRVANPPHQAQKRNGTSTVTREKERRRSIATVVYIKSPFESVKLFLKESKKHTCMAVAFLSAKRGHFTEPNRRKTLT